MALREYRARLHSALFVTLAAAAMLATATSTAAGGSAGATPLDRYLNGLASLRTAFTQSVADARGREGDMGSGLLLVQRPGKFRWEYQPRSGDTGGGHGTGAAGPNNSGQLLIADGRNLWFYDRELAQITVKPVAQALSATPVMLLSGPVAELRNSFDITTSAAHDGLEWVSVTPRAPEADFNRAELGFKGDQLLRMIVHDRLGQTVTLEFGRSTRNGRMAASDFEFKPPQGVDVIGTPES